MIVFYERGKLRKYGRKASGRKGWWMGLHPVLAVPPDESSYYYGICSPWLIRSQKVQ
jgi:hypothetical protein